jgi:hypothetical protein
MSTEENASSQEEALIRKLTAQYEKQLRQALKKKPSTLEQIEDTAEEVGKQVQRDIEEQVIQKQGTGEQGQQTACRCGRPARYIADYPKRLVTRHGVLRIERAYYYCRACGKDFCPLDIRLGLGWGEYSPAVVALGARFAGYLPPRAAVRELAAVCGITLCANTLRQHAHRMGVALQEAWEQEESAFFAHPQKQVLARPKQLHLTLDGVMVHVDGAWQEVKLGCAYTRGKWGGVETARYSATLHRSSAFGKRFRVLGHLCGADNCRNVGIVADGAEWIWQESGKYYPSRVQILDYYHAKSHLWKVAHLWFGEGSEAGKQWMAHQQEHLLSDRVTRVITEVGGWQATTELEREEQRRVLEYLVTHTKRMRYQTFQAQGFHIGSGVAEAGCKAVVQARLKGPGMRWKQAGAEAMLHLRCAICSTQQPDFRQLARQTMLA